jgi:hypothetical protein
MCYPVISRCSFIIYLSPNKSQDGIRICDNACNSLVESTEQRGKGKGTTEPAEFLGPADPRFLALMQKAGREHARRGVVPEQYGAVGAAFLWTLEQGLGDGFTAEVKEAWAWAYGAISKTMIAGGDRSPEEKKIDIVRDTWATVMTISDTAADLFYKRLFEVSGCGGCVRTIMYVFVSCSCAVERV